MHTSRQFGDIMVVKQICKEEVPFNYKLFSLGYSILIL